MENENTVLQTVWLYLKQRRLWAALLSGVAAFSVSFGYDVVGVWCTSIAGALGLWSYVQPKK